MVKRVAQDRPLSFEDVGVIGAAENAVDSEVQPKLSEEQQAAAARPASAGVENAGGFFASGFDRAPEPEEPQSQQLPEGYEDWPGYKIANGSARADFLNAVLFPGHIFIAGGRYVNVQDTDKVYDVTPGEVIPDNVYLLGVNYLVPGPERDKILRGERPARRATREPNPLRSNKE